MATYQFIFFRLPKCFKIKKTSYICKLLKTRYGKTSPFVYDLIFIDTGQWTYSLIKLFLFFKRANQEERIFLFCVTRESRRILCTKIVDLCLFFKKDVKQWKFCTSKGNIGTDNKRSITVIFIINLHGTSLPMQLICCGENVKRLNKFDFLEGSPTESIKIIK